MNGVTQLDVRPSTVSYTSNLEPGDQKRSSDDGYAHLDIENAGSQNIEQIHAEADMPTEQPFGTTVTDVYNTGNFLEIGFETARDLTNIDGQTPGTISDTEGNEYDNQSYINRIEYYEENPPEYIETPDDTWEIARLREGSVEYFVAAKESYTDGTTFSSDGLGEIRIGKAPHTPTQLGTTDFTTSSEYISISADQMNTLSGASDTLAAFNNSLQLASFDLGDTYDGENILTIGSENDIDVDPTQFGTKPSGLSVSEYALIMKDQTTDANSNDQEPGIYRTSVNVMPGTPATVTGDGTTRTDFNPDGLSDTGVNPIFSASGPENQLQPGGHFPVDFSIRLPQGVDNGEITDGEVSFYASTVDNAPDPLSN